MKRELPTSCKLRKEGRCCIDRTACTRQPGGDRDFLPQRFGKSPNTPKEPFGGAEPSFRGPSVHWPTRRPSPRFGRRTFTGSGRQETNLAARPGAAGRRALDAPERFAPLHAGRPGTEFSRKDAAAFVATRTERCS